MSLNEHCVPSTVLAVMGTQKCSTSLKELAAPQSENETRCGQKTVLNLIEAEATATAHIRMRQTQRSHSGEPRFSPIRQVT